MVERRSLIRDLSPRRLFVETPRSFQRQQHDRNQRRGCGQSEDQMIAHLRQPLRADRRGLAEGTREVSAGNFEYQVPEQAQDELGVLVRSFNTMTTQLRDNRSQIDQFTEIAKNEGAGGLAYLTYESGEVKSPIAKFLKPEELDAIQQKTGAVDGDVVFFGDRQN